MKRILAAALAVGLILLSACGPRRPAAVPPLEPSPYRLGRTLYGFFPSPPEATRESILATYRALREHGDVVLLQQNIPWRELATDPEARSRAVDDIRNQFILAHRSGLEVLFVIDPLNGLNRTEFFGLPAGWQPAFSAPEVRAAFGNFCRRIVAEFHPRYLGLASEINTYADAHPEDFPHFVSLYREMYARIKSEAPETRVFVTFQWEDLNNLIPQAAEGRPPYRINWETVEAFEPQLDLWAISSYPFVAFRSGADIPPDYYTPLLARTSKPLAVAEGGYTSAPVGPVAGTPQDQLSYLRAIHGQLGGPRLEFWIYLLWSDLNLDSYAPVLRNLGLSARDVDTFGFFTFVGLRGRDGTPKPALALWDSFR